MAATKARKTKKTAAQTVEGWIAGAARTTRSADDLGWMAGQVGCLTVDGLHYEQFELPTGGYVVVKWDDDGNACVL
jgi:hypothetical protein